MMPRRTFLGLLIAAVGFRLKAEPTEDVTQIPNRVWVHGVDLAKGPDTVGWVMVGERGPEVFIQGLSREDVARFHHIEVSGVLDQRAVRALREAISERIGA